MTVDMHRTSLVVEPWDTDPRWSVMAGHQLLDLHRQPSIDLFGRTLVRQGDAIGQGDPASLFSTEHWSAIERISEPADMVLDCLYRVGRVPPDRVPFRCRRTVTFGPAVRGAAWNPSLPVTDLVQGQDSIVVPSRWSRDRILAHGVAPEQVVVVPLGVDASEFLPLTHGERDATRAELKVRAGEIVFLNVADASADAGIDVLLLAFARLRRAGLAVRLVLRTEQPSGEADYEAAIRTAASSEPALLQPETLAAITMLPGPLERSRLRLLYGMADCYVSPYRAKAFDAPVLEAIATGTPVIVTSGGATDDVCDDDVAWRIAGELRRDDRPAAEGGGTFIEPDPDALSDALREVAQGRGFDRLRFAEGRMRLLRRCTWRRSALALAAVITGSARTDGEAGRTPIRLSGLAQPTDDRFAAQSPTGLPALRRRARSFLRCGGGNELSMVVQGPCLRDGGDLGVPPIDDALASIRRHFPGAQIVVSTWAGSDVDGLDADEIVLSADPGPFINNVNRQITSTANGFAAATRPFAIKTRNDIVFHSDALARKPLWRAGDTLSLERRIWAESNRIETSLRPFHPSDIIQFGTTDDLRRLWDVPVVTLSEDFLPGMPAHLVRPASEQAIFLGYLRGIGVDVDLESTFDGRYPIVAGSIASMLAAFDVFDAEEEEIALAPKFRKNPARIRLMETHASFERLRHDFERDPQAVCRRVCEEALAVWQRHSAA